MDAPSNPQKPARLLKQAALTYVFLQIGGLVLLAICDADQDAYYFRFFALALIWSSASVVVSAYLSIRRAWQGQPAADVKDGLLPAAVLFVLGWFIWTGVHLIP